jgi:adenylate cyclase class 2
VRSENVETEVKLPLKDAETGRSVLEQAGFRVSRQRSHESNLVLDTADGAIRRDRRLLRLRAVAGQTVLAYKGPPQPGRHKIREEIELDVSDSTALQDILERLGYSPVWRYEKFRTEFTRGSDPGHICLDETPVGAFLELEGASEWIDQTARELGFSEAHYILSSYGRLYLEACAQRGVEPGDMTFPARK